MQVRKATCADYDDVTSIGRMFDKCDYLPGLFEVLTRSGLAHVLLGFVKNNCVS